ncbi:MAG: tRNA (adenosine(37)-N6)-threonylcarbamoyltransferase complex ATPase subunit type 1 TsaE [Verrucomicrobiota bacterium]|nr:MAG: tRNA (adenosine(37)-N6)-threonylcarbamoyltransferase complex ATPase subunit type 1 TsaE [Verrucomicrobiota bacterium]
MEVPSFKWICPTPEALIRQGEVFGKTLQAGDIIALAGNLGVGKTTFVKGIARALGVTEPITSPTFNIASIYSGSDLTLVHIDAYRLETGMSIDILEYVTPPYIVVIEWPAHFQELNSTHRVTFSVDVEGVRHLVVTRI